MRTAPRFQFVWHLYHCSHSLLVFAAVFGLVWAILRRPDLEMLGWALHILIDILKHKGIFAVHFLWPLSNFGFNGIRWENCWFLALNYAMLLSVLAWLCIHTRKAYPSTSPSGVKALQGNSGVRSWPEPGPHPQSLE